MAANIFTQAFAVIDVIDLSRVRGGVAQQAAVMQRAYAHEPAAVQRAIAHALSGRADGDRVRVQAPAYDDRRDNNDQLSPLLARKPRRRSGSGPTPAPALPPASTLTR